MSVYRDELQAAQRQGRAVHDALEAWVSRPAGAADDTPASALEAHARDLRDSRERLLAVYRDHGDRDDIMAALQENEAFHRGLGLSIRDKPDIDPESEE